VNAFRLQVGEVHPLVGLTLLPHPAALIEDFAGPGANTQPAVPPQMVGRPTNPQLMGPVSFFSPFDLAVSSDFLVKHFSDLFPSR